MREFLIQFWPSIFTLIGIGSLFFSHPKQVEQWKKKPPVIRKPSPKRVFLSILVGILVAGITSIIFSTNAEFATMNFIIICTIYALYFDFIQREIKKYSKR